MKGKDAIIGMEIVYKNTEYQANPTRFTILEIHPPTFGMRRTKAKLQFTNDRGEEKETINFLQHFQSIEEWRGGRTYALEAQRQHNEHRAQLASLKQAHAELLSELGIEFRDGRWSQYSYPSENGIFIHMKDLDKIRALIPGD